MYLGMNSDRGWGVGMGTDERSEVDAVTDRGNGGSGG